MKSLFRAGLIFLFFCLCAGSFAQRAKTAADYYNAGKVFQDKKDWYAASGQYLEAVRLNPSYGKAWFSLSECSYALGEYDLALSYADAAQKFGGETPEVRNLRGFTLIGLGRLAEAREAFAAVLVKYPNDTQARFGLAELDLFDGKVSGAEAYYQEALRRQPENRQALLSLALVSQALGKNALARTYINQALRYHADNAEVYYFAAYVSAQEGGWAEAETRVRSAMYLDPSYDASYELLATVLFAQKRWQEVIDVCDYRIARNRSLQSAWYVKAVALERLGLNDEALSSLQTGLEIDPEDEVMRTAAEQLVFRLPIEDPQRPYWARWHVIRAREAAQKYLYEQAKYEYRRALLIDPQDTKTRLAYAQILLGEGYPETYAAQLKFVRERGDTSTAVADKIEAYDSLLQNSLGKKWNIDPFYLDKTRWKFGLYCLGGSVQMLHPGADQVTSRILAEVLSSGGEISAEAYGDPVADYAQAFRLARQSGQDYFGLVSFEENDRELTVSLSLYVGRTGSEAGSWRVYRIGNGRYSDALRKIQQSVYAALPLRGRILARNGFEALADLGKIDGVEADQVFTIIKNGQVSVAEKGIGLLWGESNVFGTLTLSRVSEDISQGTIKPLGYFDRVNVGDEIVFVAADEQPTAQLPVPDTQKPALVNLIRLIY